MLHPQQQLNQFFLRQALQISAIHLPMDSGIAPADKCVGNYVRLHIRTDKTVLTVHRRADDLDFAGSGGRGKDFRPVLQVRHVGSEPVQL
jgi:hypothetical protein